MKELKDVSIFQKYTARENIHSSSALLLIRELYKYNMTYFYDFISKITDDDKDGENDFLPHFRTQIKIEKGDTVPDFAISQEGFTIYAEAKESDNIFTDRQIEGHLKTLNNEKGNKILLLLSPIENGETYKHNKYQNITIKPITYEEICKDMEDVLDKSRDYEFCQLLEEFKEYCFEQNLIDCAYKTMKVRAVGNTFEFNKKYDIYFDDEGTNIKGFNYIGLYNNKFIVLVGKISKIVIAKLKNGELDIKSSTKNLSEEEKTKLSNAINDKYSFYNLKDDYYTFFMVEKFVDTKCEKKSSRGLYGSKIMSFDTMMKGFNKNMAIKEIAEKIKDYEW